MILNIYTAWIGFFLGCVAGATSGLFFHDEDWLGGYTSWRRRMTRLAHISFFGIAFINLSFAFTARVLKIEDDLVLSSYLFIIGAITMPLVCYLSAARKAFRHLFFIPALAVTLGVAVFLWEILAV